MRGEGYSPQPRGHCLFIYSVRMYGVQHSPMTHGSQLGYPFRKTNATRKTQLVTGSLTTHRKRAAQRIIQARKSPTILGLRGPGFPLQDSKSCRVGWVVSEVPRHGRTRLPDSDLRSGPGVDFTGRVTSVRCRSLKRALQFPLARMTTAKHSGSVAIGMEPPRSPMKG